MIFYIKNKLHADHKDSVPQIVARSELANHILVPLVSDQRFAEDPARWAQVKEQAEASLQNIEIFGRVPGISANYKVRDLALLSIVSLLEKDYKKGVEYANLCKETYKQIVEDKKPAYWFVICTILQAFPPNF